MHRDLYRHRSRVAALVRRRGIRKMADLAGLPAMRVSRFCSAKGGDDAETLYRLCDALGFRVKITSQKRGENVLDPSWLIV